MVGYASDSDTVTISEAARCTGLTTRAIRYYERIGLVEAAPRSSRNYRLYDEKALNDLRSVARYRAVGMSIAEIRALRSGLRRQTKDSRKANLLRQQLKLTEARIRELLSVRRELQRQLGPSRVDRNPATALSGPVRARRFGVRH